MGVHGLTTFLRENRRLSKSLSLPSDTPSDPVHLVVDGWSFIYELLLKSSLPWVYGGEYLDYSRIITVVVKAWLSVGLRLSFVFDGPVPEIKFSTLISRLAKSHIEPALLFFRTSQASRATPRFLNESRIIPPLAYTVTIHTLTALRGSTPDLIDIHFADEEGDPYAVELAGKLGAYVAGNDSDFAILNSEGYLGFVPLDGMVWTAPFSEDPNIADPDDDFQEVRNSKRKISRHARASASAGIGRGIVPPENVTDLTLSFTAYSPNSLASFLKIPVTLLPLLGSLIGNDFSNQSAAPGKQVQQLFFERQMAPSARINRVAATLQSILSVSAQKKKAKYHVDSVMDLIDKTVRTLLIRPASSMGSGEIEAIVERVVESTLQYAIPKYDGDSADTLWPSPICALHEPDLCQMLPMFSRKLAMRDWQEEDVGSGEFAKMDAMRRALLQQYRAGRLSPNVINCLNTGTLWPRLFLENPDVESTSRMTRPIRQWYCAILEDAVGLPELPEEPQDEIGQSTAAEDDEEEDEDELIDVVESDTEDEDGKDVLAPLKGALQRLHEPSHPPSERPASSSTTSLDTCIVTEYVRRGTRVVDELVTIPPLAELLKNTAIPGFDHTSHTPFLTRSVDERLAVFLCALNSDIPNIRDLPPVHILTAVALRWLLRALHVRAQENPSKDNLNARWTVKEIRCLLASFAWDGVVDSSLAQTYPTIIDRHVQFAAQVLQCLENVHQLAEVMFLDDIVSSPAHLFSGRRFHGYLTGAVPVPDDAFPTDLWEACVYGLEDSFGEERTKKPKKKTKNVAQGTPILPNKKNKNTNSSLFDLLGDVEA